MTPEERKEQSRIRRARGRFLTANGLVHASAWVLPDDVETVEGLGLKAEVLEIKKKWEKESEA